MGYKLNNGGAPIDMIREIIQGHNIENFVETGTSSGQSVLAALNSGLFKNIYSVELVEGRTNPEILQQLPDNVHLYNGDSVEFLDNLKFLSPSVYWLDAHYSDSVPAADDVVECPIIDELESILVRNGKNNLIIIDDARLFFGAPPEPHNPKKWVRFDKIVSFVKRHALYQTQVTIVDDYIVIVPENMYHNFDEYWRKTFHARYA